MDKEQKMRNFLFSCFHCIKTNKRRLENILYIQFAVAVKRNLFNSYAFAINPQKESILRVITLLDLLF